MGFDEILKNADDERVREYHEIRQLRLRMITECDAFAKTAVTAITHLPCRFSISHVYAGASAEKALIRSNGFVTFPDSSRN